MATVPDYVLKQSVPIGLSDYVPQQSLPIAIASVTCGNGKAQRRLARPLGELIFPTPSCFHWVQRILTQGKTLVPKYRLAKRRQITPENQHNVGSPSGVIR